MAADQPLQVEVEHSPLLNTSTVDMIAEVSDGVTELPAQIDVHQGTTAHYMYIGYRAAMRVVRMNG